MSYGNPRGSPKRSSHSTRITTTGRICLIQKLLKKQHDNILKDHLARSWEEQFGHGQIWPHVAGDEPMGFVGSKTSGVVFGNPNDIGDRLMAPDT
ncbi:unnamed protein product [Arabidopsis thaliana]|uniref:Uncharacterized protein n=1 Tax=Arabidopsis thaliana TaxID=3702 RepID=A0A5S9WYK3_ARATH|nr:unnamed protein product [Arabidopsis thaliana]